MTQLQQDPTMRLVTLMESLRAQWALRVRMGGSLDADVMSILHDLERGGFLRVSPVRTREVDVLIPRQYYTAEFAHMLIDAVVELEGYHDAGVFVVSPMLADNARTA